MPSGQLEPKGFTAYRKCLLKTCDRDFLVLLIKLHSQFQIKQQKAMVFHLALPDCKVNRNINLDSTSR